MRVPLARPHITEVERDLVAATLADAWVSGTGPSVTAFEEALAERIGKKYAVATANGTLALELALRVLDIGPGDEVIVPMLTFVAPAAVVCHAGATPVFVDVDPATWTIDPTLVERAITDKTKAVIAVDLMATSCYWPLLREVCETRDVHLIEDAAQAHGTRYGKQYCGSFGDISTFSFHANKAITTGEGGAFLTDSPAHAAAARLIANHGMTVQRPYWHTVIASNYRMPNLCAALGLAQLERWDTLIEGRRKVAALYDERLGGMSVFTEDSRKRRLNADDESACWLYPASTRDRSERDQILIGLNEAGIDARAIWPVLTSLPPYKDFKRIVRHRHGRSNAEFIAQRTLWLPTWVGLPVGVIEEIRALALAYEQGDNLRVNSQEVMAS